MAVYQMETKSDRDMEGYDELNPLALECARQELTKAVKEGRVDGLERAILVYITEAAINAAGDISNARTVGIDPAAQTMTVNWDTGLPSAATQRFNYVNAIPGHRHEWCKLEPAVCPPAALGEPCYGCAICHAHTHTPEYLGGRPCNACWPNDFLRDNWENEQGDMIQ